MEVGAYSETGKIQKFDLNDEFISNIADIDVICSDGIAVKAHKIILGGRCDFFFKLIFYPPKTTNIVLNQMDSKMFKKVLPVIYGSSVRIPEEEIDEFLKICGDLRINYWVKFDKKPNLDEEIPADVPMISSGSTPTLEEFVVQDVLGGPEGRQPAEGASHHSE